MKQIRPLGDERVLAGCVYCGSYADTRDHVPPKVLLDEPYPENLPVVPSCRACNESSSLDEEYVAALLDCVMVGSVEPTQRHRDKVRHILAHQPALATVLEHARKGDEKRGTVAFDPDVSRVRKVVLKLARGHAAFELHSPMQEDPTHVTFAPFSVLTEGQREAFETPSTPCVYPEVGSRAMLRMFEQSESSSSWINVQGGYRFLASPGLPLLVRIVINEYLACEVVWED